MKKITLIIFLGLIIAFSNGIDATCLVKSFQVCFSQGAIVGGAYPNHFIPISNMDNAEEMKEQLTECIDGKHGDLAPEVKASVISFQHVPGGMCPYLVLGGRSQSINENNDFGTLMMEACVAAAKEDGNAVILNSSTDGVSCEVQWNLSVTNDYIEGMSYICNQFNHSLLAILINSHLITYFRDCELYRSARSQSQYQEQ